jgi:protein-tyrosine-phosphatase
MNVAASESDLIEPLRMCVLRAVREADQIPPDRKRTLEQAAQFIRQHLDAGTPAQLTFVCTHNSRRSHLAQVWAQTAAAYYGVTNIQTASGGTEATACNIRTVKALRRAGFSVADSTGGKNPVYIAQISDAHPGIRLFSKVYDHPDNPQKDFAVLMCCDQADQGCPVVIGAAARFAIHYQDPKVSDNTNAESATYDERCRQIAREMFYMVSQIRAATTAKN